MGERWERKRQRPCEQQKADVRAAEKSEAALGKIKP
jgi:hypothetical protein